MFVYWSMVLVPALLSLSNPGRRTALAQGMLAVLFVALFMFLALRETGGDYPMYLNLYDLLQGETLERVLELVEPGYGFLNWASSQFGMGLYGVNAACALIFLFCLYRGASMERDPLFIVSLAIPYFVIVVAMGYTRQGVAAALVWLAMTHMRENRLLAATLTIALGSCFHFSAFAAMAFPIIGVSREQKGAIWIMSRLVLAVVIAVAARTLLSDTVQTYSAAYLESDRYESGGAFLRSLVTGMAGAMFFLRRREFKKYDDYGIWRPFAALALILVPLSLYVSTPADRAGLYLLPFQLVVFTRLPAVLFGGTHYTLIHAVVLLNYLAYFFVWLHLGSFAAELWIPYRWLLS